MSSRFSRRSLLGMVPFGTLAASGFFGLAGGTEGCMLKTVAPSSGGGKKVVILGAGLAGLTAAWELVKANQGFDVTILEAQARVGGRVYTVREGFSNGHYAEMGAIRIPDVHDATLGLIQELNAVKDGGSGITLTEWPAGGDPLYYLQGKRFVHTDGPWPLDGLTDAERARGLDMYEQYAKARFAEVGDPRKGTFPLDGALSKFDGQTYVEFLQANGASDAWIKLYTSDNGSEIAKIGALAWLAADVADQAWDKTFHVDGGNDKIPKGLADAIGQRARLQFEAVVKRIDHSPSSVKVTFEQAGRLEEITADRCVCALPPTVVRRLEIGPVFADDKMRALRQVFMMNAGRAYFQTKSRFWEAEKIGGLKIAKTDTKIERVWDIGAVQGGMRTGLIVGYMQHENANLYAAVAGEDRRAYATREMAKFFPQIESEATAFAHHAWSEDPFVEGAWTDLLPNQGYAFAALPRVEGRVHFAGEHTSIWAGWMQGAIESGRRAAKEILAVTPA